MNSKRAYFTMLTAIALLAIGLIIGAYEADKLLAKESAKLLNDRLLSSVLAKQQDDLIRAKQEVSRYQDLANIAKSVVPQDKDQAQTVREIVKLANENHLTLGSITFPSSTLGGVAGSTSTKSQQLSQLSPVKGIAGVYALQITAQSDSNKPVLYSDFLNFLSALEHNRRTALVRNITIQPDAKTSSAIGFTLTLDEYIKP